MSLFRTLNLVSLVLCFCVVVFGAYVRLADAGLGCPDWPGCYGHVGIPDADHEIAAAEAKYPERPVEAGKAWKEMIHRYLASTLGLLIVIMAFVSVRAKSERMPRILPWFLVGLVMFQGVLGMWTVTWQLKPLIVTAHLAGGMSTLSLLLWLFLSTRPPGDRVVARLLMPPRLPAFASLALLVLVAQILLGGWTSTNYAALACPDFPKCHGQWLPETDLGEAFTLWRGLGVNYEFGVLDNRARVTIHFFHRLGAILVALVLFALSIRLLRTDDQPWPTYGVLILAALGLQLSLGISTVILQLPLLLAAAHNAGAALLLMSLVALNHDAWKLVRT